MRWELKLMLPSTLIYISDHLRNLSYHLYVYGARESLILNYNKVLKCTLKWGAAPIVLSSITDWLN